MDLTKDENTSREASTFGKENSALPMNFNDSNTPPAKKSKRSIHFDKVQIFYFPRQQGFISVPAAGGCTLGMALNHVAFKVMSVEEHLGKLSTQKNQLNKNSPEPISAHKRFILLKAAGIHTIDAVEKFDCHQIRKSRKEWGCACRGFCEPKTCSCSQADIMCQTGYGGISCGCYRSVCGNMVGRAEYSYDRQLAYTRHKLMRLKQKDEKLNTAVFRFFVRAFLFLLEIILLSVGKLELAFVLLVNPGNATKSGGVLPTSIQSARKRFADENALSRGLVSVVKAIDFHTNYFEGLRLHFLQIKSHYLTKSWLVDITSDLKCYLYTSLQLNIPASPK
uniref:Cysteine/serine-rich nuclear protein N-terminal domain-containing protein n=1 Tax=Glossina palpalis gambiensis TaxID=67801 RepID=A0A1B0BHM5_9MUSC